MKKLLFLLFFPAFAFAAGSTSNTLTWDYGTYDVVGNPNGITATLLFKKAEACAGTALTFAQVASVPFPTLTYDDPAIKQGLTYCYEAQAQNPAGVSVMSNQVAKTVPFALPPAPGNVIVK